MKIKSGLNTKQWSDWRKDLLTTGTYDPNNWHELNSYQRTWTKDTLNTLNMLKQEYENGN